MPRVQMVSFDGEKLREAISAKALSPTTLASRAGCCIETARLALRGKPIGEMTARAIARVVGLGLRSLVADEPRPVEAA